MRTRSKVALAVGFAAVGVGALLAASRSSARDGLEDLLARLRRDGRLPTVENLRAEMPKVDADLQARVTAWGLPRASGGPAWGEAEEEWWSIGAPEGDRLPDGVRAWFEGFRPRAEELASLLETDRVRLSSLAWRVLDVPAAGPPPLASDSSPLFEPLQGPPIDVLIDAERWFVLASRTDSTALRSLDRLARSLSPPGSMLDAHIGLAFARTRDEAYARAALGGAVPHPDLEGWLDDSPAPHVAAADGLRAERSLFWERVARRLLDGRPLARPWKKDATDPIRLWREHVGPWIHGRDDCRRFLESHVALEDVVRGGESPQAAEAFAEASGLGWPFAMWTELGPAAYARQYARMLATLGALRRAARVVAVLATDGGGRGEGLPDSEADLRTRLGRRAVWLDGGPTAFGLAYERFGEDGVRLKVVPKELLPGVPGADEPSATAPDPAEPPAQAAAPFRWAHDRVEARIPSR